MQHSFLFRALPAILLISGGISSCTKNYSPPPPTTVEPNMVLATDANLGKILTDSSGKTLYSFSLDANGSSACTGGCLAIWPAFYKAHLKLGTGLDSSDFGTITRTDGSMQTTYKGWPLYHFANDAKPGDIHGDGFLNIWFVAKPDYTVMLANTQLVGNDGVSYDSTYHPGTGEVQYLTDDKGATLYSFSFDKAGTNNFTKSDFSNDSFWPIYQVTSPLVAPSSINKSLLSTIMVFGKTQLTYNGWPMHHFGADNGIRGSTKGVSVPSPGIWHIQNLYTAAAPQ